MTEYEGLYTTVIKDGPKEIERDLARIPGIHKQEAMDNALEKAITLTGKPKIQNIKFLLKLGADPNGPSDTEGTALSYAYSKGLEDLVELLLHAGANVNATHSTVLEQAVKKGDRKYTVRFVEAGADLDDNSKLLYSDDLLEATDVPEIKKYLVSKNIESSTPELEEELENVKLIKLSDFDYGEPPEVIHETTELHIKDYSPKFVLVTGNTKNHQALLRRYGGRFVRGKGWLVPKSKHQGLQEAIEKLDTPEPKIQTPETPETLCDIDLYTIYGDYGYLTVAFTRPSLFRLDGHVWDSVERYLMYKMYEGSYKGNAIKEAKTLDIARKKFNVHGVSTAKTPKQLVLNQKLLPLARSVINNGYLQHREQLFYKANKAKFDQNSMYRGDLLNTRDCEIINHNFHDFFGYEGNLLGNTLMKLRDEYGGAEYNQKNATKTNSLVVERYQGNKNFYVIRGDPDTDLATDIRALGTYTTKNKKVIRGKLNLNLQGGAGWLVPISKKTEMKELLFNVWPDQKKMEVYGRDWIKKQLEMYLAIAILFSRFRDKQEVGSDDLLFSIKDVFGAEEFLGEKGNEPDDRFVRTAWKYAEHQGAVLSDTTIQLLWDFLSKVVLEISRDVTSFGELKDILRGVDVAILDIPINPIEGLTERESIIIESFTRLYKLLRRINDAESKVCITVAGIMLGDHHYQEVRKLYAKKSKLSGGSEYPNEETQFRKRFHIKTLHIQTILDHLPKSLDKKCKLLVLTILDYIMELDGDDAIEISKRLILLSQKGKQPTPTPKTPAPQTPEKESDIPKPEESPESKPAESSPPFEGTPEETPGEDEE